MPRITDKVMVITEHGDRDQIAVLEEDVLVQHYVTRTGARSMVGNVYLGRVQNVLPGMEAAFIDIGRGRNGVLYAGEVNYSPEDLEGPQPRIEQILKNGQSVMVQVTKDPMGGKGARLTAQISMPGRFLVFVPNANISGISRRLPDEERRRLKTIMKKVRPEGHGVIVRTAAEGASEEALTADLSGSSASGTTSRSVEEGEGSGRALRGAGAHRSRGARPVHRRGVQGARDRLAARVREGACRTSATWRRTWSRRCICTRGGSRRSRSTGSSSRSTRRSTRRSGCRRAAICSSNAPKR